MSLMNRRDVMKTGIAAGAAAVAGAVGLEPRRVRAQGANDEIRLGFISCGGRARELMRTFSGVDGVRVAGLCDPDQGRLRSANENYPEAKAWVDLRELVEDPELDAVVVATCNHWHCLAAIWAMEAGKDVYVEKPLSHSQWEGEQAIAAAAKYDRICQLGTQQRSDPMQAEIKKFLHVDRKLGDIQMVRVNRYGVRPSIGKRDTPLPVPEGVDMNLWLGPAQEKPIFRNQLQYDWHWDWNTGSGEMGNWGVHVLDDVRNNVFQDQVKLPQRVFGGGGRVLWNDAGETPNVHFVFFDTGVVPVVIGLANIKESPNGGTAKHPGPGSGYIVYCEGGRLEGQRGRAVAFDQDGKEVQRFSGNSGNGLHQANFIQGVRSRDATQLNAHVQVGHDSTGWCNLANIVYRVGDSFSWDRVNQVDQAKDLWAGLLDQTEKTLGNHGMKLADESIQLSTMLQVDPKTERFVGENATAANAFIKREYRRPFVVPDLTS